MRDRVNIIIEAAYASVDGDARVTRALGECLAFESPQAKRTLAYRQGRWDGRIRLFQGRRFPAGLAPRLAEHLRRRYGIEAVVTDRSLPGKPDVKRVSRDLLEGLTLWDQQYDAVLAMLTHPRCVVQVPTGGGKTAIIAAVAKVLWEQFRYRTLAITSRRGLTRKNARAFRQLLGNHFPVGQFGDGSKSTGIITSASAQSLIRCVSRTYYSKSRRRWVTASADPRVVRLVQSARVLVFDECQHTSSRTWFDVGMVSPAPFRYGLSGTPLVNKALEDARLVGATGPLVYSADESRIIDEGISKRPRIVMLASPAVSGPAFATSALPHENPAAVYARRYARTYLDRDSLNARMHNRAQVRALRWLIRQGRRSLLLCRRLDHFAWLAELLDAAGVRYRKLAGATPTAERDASVRAFADRRVDALLATTILDEGEDIPAVDAIVVAEGVKSLVSVIQRIGRGKRVVTGGPSDLWFVDTAPTCDPVLYDHACRRCEVMENAGYDVRLVTDWPAGNGLPDDLLPFRQWDGVAEVCVEGSREQ